MSDRNVRTLSQPSNRANPKDTKEKKVVFKGVLDSPFRILWPSVPVNLQNSIFAYITQRLDGASDYHFNRCALSRKRKRAAKVLDERPKKKKSKIEAENPESSLEDPNPLLASDLDEDPGAVVPPPSAIHQDDKTGTREPPLLLRHMTYGINEVTKKLELQTQNARRTTIGTVPILPAPLKYVFVCRADVDPALLIDHLPHLVAAYNSNCLNNPIKLVTLPRGSELALAHKLGIRRVTVLAIDNAYEDQQMAMMLEQVPILAASWLAKPNAAAPTPLIATHVKHLRTTAPRDMKAAKDLRTRQKADVKKKRSLEKKTSTSV